METKLRGSRSEGPGLRQAGDFAVGLAVCGYLIAASVGLPLFEDGSFYLFVIATEQAPELPNLRVTGVLPQLPAVAAFSLGADLPLGRLVFSAAYMAIPLVNLVGCWWLLRRRSPALLMLVLPSFLGLQLNFSGVSELLSGVYLTWWVLLAMLLLPERRWVMAVASAWAPLMLMLHPLAFILCFGLAAVAWLLSRQGRERIDARGRIAWRRIGLWLAANGLARLAWTALALNAYERGRLEPSSALNYLFGETTAQHLLIGILVLATLLSFRALHRAREPASRSRLLVITLWLALLSSCWVGAHFVLGQGIVLKSVITVAVALLGMVAVTLLVLQREADPTRARGRVPSAAVRLAGVALLTLLLAKSSAWWTGIRGLQDIVASSDTPCIRLGADEPYSLQWPWMRVTDGWATPFTALVTRPFVPGRDGAGPHPVAVMLDKDGCERLRATGEVRLPADTRIPFERLNAAFGPLRRP